jgi:hypothetical protein
MFLGHTGINVHQQVQAIMNTTAVSSGTPEAGVAQAYNVTWGGYSYDLGYGVAVDVNGDIYIVGETNSFGIGSVGGNYSAFLVKYAPNGTQLWNTTWGGPDGAYGYGVAVDPGGNPCIVGSENGGMPGSVYAFVAKFAANGTQLWNQTWGGPGDNEGMGIAVDSSGNILIAGYNDSFVAGGNASAFLVKYDINGTQVWNSTWGDTGDNQAYGVAVDWNGNIYITGATNNTWNGNYDAFLVKYDPNGFQSWNETWSDTENVWANGVAVDESGNPYIVGYDDGYAFVIKCDSSGDQLWSQTWGNAVTDDGFSIAIDNSGNAIIAGKTNSTDAGNYDAFLAAFSSEGNQLWNCTWGGTGDDEGYGVAVDVSGNIDLAGLTYSFGVGSCNAFLVQYYPYFLPGVPTLYSISSSTNSTLSLSWSPADGATYYYVYEFNQTISSLNDSVTPLGPVYSTSYIATNLTNGIWFFVVVAENDSGASSISNCVAGFVNIPAPSFFAQYGLYVIIACAAAAVIVVIGVVATRRRKSKPPSAPKKVLPAQRFEAQVVNKLPKKAPGGKSGSSQDTPQPLTAEAVAELQRTEQEVTARLDVKMCVVHKGPIKGANYACPQCATFYCFNCALVLKRNGEGCWSCGHKIELDESIFSPADAKPVPLEETEVKGEDQEGEIREIPDDSREVADNNRMVPEDSHDVPEDSHEVPEDSHEVPEDSHEVPEDSHEVPEDSHEVPEDSHEVPEDSHDVPEDSHDVPEDSHDVPEDSHEE